jgi:hypothetical protein
MAKAHIVFGKVAKKKRRIVDATKTKFFFPIQLSIFFKWQSKVIDSVDPSLPSFLYIVFIYH